LEFKNARHCKILVRKASHASISFICELLKRARRPLTFTGNKHMLPIANKPMLFYGLEHLTEAGIHEIGIVLGPIKEGVREAVEKNSGTEAEITYIDQPEPKGLAHAVLISEEFLGDEPFVMYLGDNLLKQGVQPFIQTFNQHRCDCVIGVTKVRDPTRYGIVEMKAGRISRLTEKPKQPKSDLALIGVYIFNNKIFQAAREIRPSWRNELEITDAIQNLLNSGAAIDVQQVQGWWKDTGRPEDLLEANQLVLSDIEPRNLGKTAQNATISGRVSIDKGTEIHEGTTIRGPAIIGRDCKIGPNTYIGPYTSIGDNTAIEGGEIENSIVMNNVQIRCGKRIVDSLIGNNATVVDSEKNLPRGHKMILGERTFVSI
jgi:glucose-1-phosphate thymidylyltransferase